MTINGDFSLFFVVLDLAEALLSFILSTTLLYSMLFSIMFAKGKTYKKEFEELNYKYS